MDGWITSRMLSSIVMPPQEKKKTKNSILQQKLDSNLKIHPRVTL